MGPTKLLSTKLQTLAVLWTISAYVKNLTKAVNPKCRFDYNLTFHIWHVGPSVNFVKLQSNLSVQSKSVGIGVDFVFPLSQLTTKSKPLPKSTRRKEEHYTHFGTRLN